MQGNKKNKLSGAWASHSVVRAILFSIIVGGALHAHAQVPSCTVSGSPAPGPDGFGTTTLYPVEVGQQITFTAACTNSPTSYQWSAAGEGTVAGSATFIHTIPWNVGGHTVTLTATNAAGTSPVVSTTVNFINAGTLQCQGNPSSVVAGTGSQASLAVSCVNFGTALVGYGTVSWKDPLGAAVTGTTSNNGRTISFTAPSTPGTYTYSATVSTPNNTGLVVSIPVTVIAPPSCTVSASPAPGPDIGGTLYPVEVGQQITFTATCTNNPTSYQWSAAGEGTVTGGSPTFVHTSPYGVGGHIVSLIATNGGGPSATVSTTVNFINAGTLQCQAGAQTPTSVAAGSQTSLSVACVNFGTALVGFGSVAWQDSQGAAVSGTTSNNGRTISFAAPSTPGSYTYKATVTNPNGTAVVSFPLTVNATVAPPVCNITASAGSVSPGTSVTLTANCTPGANSYAWTGGTCASVTTASCTATPTATTTYGVAGINAGGRGPTSSVVVTVAAQIFPITPSATVTPTNTNATAQIQPAPRDVGTNASIFVFAHAPLSLLAKSAAKFGSRGAPVQQLDGPDLCVLAQVDPATGGLVPVTADTMRALITGVLGSQTQLITIINNVPTPVVAGAAFFVGYGPNAGTMLNSGTYQGVVVVNGHVQCTAAVAAPAAPNTPSELSGLWWNSAESGWGIHFTQRRNVIFAAWYTYDAGGIAKWYVSTCNMPGTNAALSGTCTGSVLEVSGPPFFGAAFDPNAVHSLIAGDLQVQFASANAATMTYTVHGVHRSIPITRQPLSSGSSVPAVNYTDLWWNSTESGWGMAMAQQSGVNFLAWYVYDSTGKPTWYVATCTMSGSACTGTLFRTTGPAFGPTFDPNAVRADAAGTITVDFTDANNANVTYTVDGVTASKSITRQIF